VEKGDLEEEMETIETIYENIRKFVSNLLPGADLIEDINGKFSFLVPMEAMDAPRLFRDLEENKERLRIQDWGVSQSTLEDVFRKISMSEGGYEK
jgi:hypothetical protein